MIRSQSMLCTLAVGGTRTKLLFTAPNFLKHFVDFWEKTLRNDSAIRQSVRAGFYRATACNATHGIAVAILSVRPSVCLSVRSSDACIVTKLNNALRIF